VLEVRWEGHDQFLDHGCGRDAFHDFRVTAQGERFWSRLGFTKNQKIGIFLIICFDFFPAGRGRRENCRGRTRAVAAEKGGAMRGRKLIGNKSLNLIVGWCGRFFIFCCPSAIFTRHWRVAGRGRKLIVDPITEIQSQQLPLGSCR